MQNLKVRSIYPIDRPSYNEWCREFNFGARYVKREGIDNAQRIMSLWDSSINMKKKFVPRSLNEKDY
jgi:hypothetical protein